MSGRICREGRSCRPNDRFSELFPVNLSTVNEVPQSSEEVLKTKTFLLLVILLNVKFFESGPWYRRNMAVNGGRRTKK